MLEEEGSSENHVIVIQVHDIKPPLAFYFLILEVNRHTAIYFGSQTMYRELNRERLGEYFFRQPKLIDNGSGYEISHRARVN